MTKIFINGTQIEVESGMTVLQACELAGIEIPRFCYHERLSIAGNCRMCIVEMENSAKPVASCAMPVAEGMKVKTNTPLVHKARKSVMEFLLINHPLDCPICDQGGECDLQDQAIAYGKGISRFIEKKRAVKDKNLGPLIKTHMTRCIHCTRCVRFSEEIAGNRQLGVIGRGEDAEITSFLEKNIDSELSGNIIDLCPVGALTSKPYEFVARPWELKKTNSIDVFDAVCSNIRIDSKGDKVLRVLPRINHEINEEWISDKTRFAYDGLNYQRIDRFYSRDIDGKLKEDSEESVLKILKKKFETIESNRIASLVGNLVDCESVFAFKLFLDKINALNYDCRQDNSFFLPRQRSSYIFNSKISGIDESDLCVLIGTDIKKEAPILSARLRQRYLQKDNYFPVLRIGCNYKTNFNVVDLGNTPKSLNCLMEEKNKRLLKKSKKPIFIIGQGAVCRDDGKEIFSYSKDLYDKICQDVNWNGFNVLQTFSGRVGALDLGFYNEKIIKSSKNLVSEIYKGRFDLVYLFCADEIDMQKIPKKVFVIYQGHHGDKGASRADLIIPTSCFTEKEGIYVNLEGRPQISRQIKSPLPNIDHSWIFFNKMTKLFNLNCDYKDFNDLRNLMFSEYNHVSCINLIEENKPFKSPQIKHKFLNEEIKSNVQNFYMTDTVSRHSPIMSSCSISFGVS